MANVWGVCAGMNLQLLIGQSNYETWARDFQVYADGRGIMDLYTGKLQVIRDKPICPVPIMKSLHDKTPYLSYTDALAVHKFKLEEWNTNRLLFQDARLCLAFWVSPEIREKVMEYESHKDAWDYLFKEYKASDKVVAAHRNAQKHMKGLSLLQTGIAQILLLFCMCVQKVEEAGGIYTEFEIMSLILSSMPERHRPIVDRALRRTPLLRRLEELDLEHLVESLLMFEAEHMLGWLCGRLQEDNQAKMSKFLRLTRVVLQRRRLGQSRPSSNSVGSLTMSAKLRKLVTELNSASEDIHDVKQLESPEAEEFNKRLEPNRGDLAAEQST